MSRFSNAFASPQSTRDHTVLIEDLARRVVRRRMTTPVLIFLESTAPLARLAGQATLVASPLLSLFIAPKTIDDIADMLQDFKNVQKLIETIHTYENERGKAYE